MGNNTRALDRQIRDAEQRLKRIRSGELSALSASEQARAYLHIGRSVRRVVRGKSTTSTEAALARVFADAEERVAAELTAAQAARQRLVAEAAAARIEKKTSGWW